MSARPNQYADAAQFRTIYDQHAAAVTAYALRRCGANEAGDVVADTFLVAWRRLADVPPEPQTRPWLLGVARRVAAYQARGRLSGDRSWGESSRHGSSTDSRSSHPSNVSMIEVLSGPRWLDCHQERVEKERSGQHRQYSQQQISACRPEGAAG